MAFWKRRALWPEYPLVTAVLIAQRTDRLPFARQSIKSFLSQSWPLKEIFVYNATGEKLGLSHKSMREICLRPMPLGTMRNICIENSNGEWCVLWDDDCWYSEDYIEAHMAKRDKETAVTLRSKTIYSVADKCSGVIDDNRIMSLSFFRLYPAKFQEDGSIAQFCQQFQKVKVVDNDPRVMVKFVSKLC